MYVLGRNDKRILSNKSWLAVMDSFFLSFLKIHTNKSSSSKAAHQTEISSGFLALSYLHKSYIIIASSKLSSSRTCPSIISVSGDPASGLFSSSAYLFSMVLFPTVLFVSQNQFTYQIFIQFFGCKKLLTKLLIMIKIVQKIFLLVETKAPCFQKEVKNMLYLKN